VGLIGIGSAAYENPCWRKDDDPFRLLEFSVTFCRPAVTRALPAVAFPPGISSAMSVIEKTIARRSMTVS
jgi:hypothetical protein